MPFSYRPLKSDEIRLLAPVSKPGQHPSHFKIHHVSLKDAPPYTAVSYTWGDQSASKSILLDGHEFPVRPNLCACLHYLSIFQQAAKWTHIWVDAICIDQNNNAEKNVQVKSMNHVYQQALTASIWLGMPYDDMNDSNWDWFDAMPDLANRPYWSRVWVIQEFLLVQDISIFCGGHQIDWLSFKDSAAEMIGMSDLRREEDADIDPDRTTQSAAFSLLARRHPDVYPELAKPLHELLTHHRLAQCKDPRDRVFAFLGMIPQDERDILLRIFPNYEMSVDEVRIVTISFLRDFGRVQMSDALFEGLGVTNVEARKRLLSYSQHVEIEDLLDAGGNGRLSMASLDHLINLDMAGGRGAFVDAHGMYGPPLSTDREMEEEALLRQALGDIEAVYDFQIPRPRKGCCGMSGSCAFLLVLFSLAAVLIWKLRST